MVPAFIFPVECSLLNPPDEAETKGRTMRVAKRKKNFMFETTE
jgi:hypothetical protein